MRKIDKTFQCHISPVIHFPLTSPPAVCATPRPYSHFSGPWQTAASKQTNHRGRAASTSLHQRTTPDHHPQTDGSTIRHTRHGDQTHHEHPSTCASAVHTPPPPSSGARTDTRTLSLSVPAGPLSPSPPEWPEVAACRSAAAAIAAAADQAYRHEQHGLH